MDAANKIAGSEAVSQPAQPVQANPAPPIPEPQRTGTRGTNVPLTDLQPTEGPVGIVSPEARQRARTAVNNAPGLIQLLAELTPSTIGATAGAALGAAGGPVGVAVGAGLGGAAGEIFAQETGVAPRSNLNLGLAAAGPSASLAVRGAGKLVARGTGSLIRRSPFIKKSISVVEGEKATEKIGSLGSELLAKQRGLLARGSSELFQAVKKAGVKIAGRELDATRKALVELSQEIKPISVFPEAKQANQLIKNAIKSLSGVNDLETVVRTRQLIGAAIRKAQNAGGIRLGASKKVFAALSDDLDRISQREGLTADAAKLAKAATQRAKLEFSVQEFEGAVSKFTAPSSDGGEFVVNFKSLSKWFHDVTDPANPRFNKNFATALKDDIPEIRELLKKTAAVTGVGSAVGRGSIVFRNLFARTGRTVVGGLLGGIMGGPAAAGLGALAFASGPEVIVAAMVSPKGRKLLEKAIRLGKGRISAQKWAVIGEFVARSVGEGGKGPSKPAGRAKRVRRSRPSGAGRSILTMP